eukprot:gnl/TRDRNA2_/TRDRNA2_178140_c0_seq1.p1 gnl/TRDRNA2_/TRDRNA2_178140_c0~~gnl/TRDRNA2_/TRDRNA2_178140_c0_seq1.p1  ORF type:complete len:424 (+),score=71.81 gnl/TRDRNA2_/TRDRNA2_178140_c0_seq1:81-1274(+)
MSAKLLVVFACCVQLSEASQSGSGARQRFAAFIAQHGRQYQEGTPEYSSRFALFQQRVMEVERHNSLPNKMWTAGINHLSDWTENELKMLRGWRGGHAPGGGPKRGASFLQVKAATKKLPEAVSWAHLKSSNTILNQGACGSCWAIATVATMNMHAEIYGANRTYSAKELMDCTPNPDKCGGKGGCDGATVELAMNYIQHGGVTTDAELPYADSNSKCQSAALASLMMGKDAGSGLQIGKVGVRKSSPGQLGLKVGLHGWERLPENEAEPLMAALAERGPVAISVSADGWNSYSHGIFDSCNKDAVIDHAVTLLGYGRENMEGSSKTFKTWLIQNSWGRFWGDSGRIKLLRHDDQHEWCGEDKQPELGTGCAGGPSKVRVCGMCGILYDNVVPHFRP